MLHKNIARYAKVAISVTIAIAAIFLSILIKIPVLKESLKGIGPQELHVFIISLLGMILLWLAVERIAIRDDYRKEVDHLVSNFRRLSLAIESPREIKFLPDDDAIYTEAIELVRQTTKNDILRATDLSLALGASKSGKNSNYIHELARRMRQAQDQKGDMEYRVAYPPRKGSPGDLANISHRRVMNAGNAVEERRRVFVGEGVKDINRRVALKMLKSDFQEEILIVGDSVIFAFPSDEGSSQIGFGISVRNVDFSKRIAGWYDHCLVAE